MVSLHLKALQNTKNLNLGRCCDGRKCGWWGIPPFLASPNHSEHHKVRKWRRWWCGWLGPGSPCSSSSSPPPPTTSASASTPTSTTSSETSTAPNPFVRLPRQMNIAGKQARLRILMFLLQAASAERELVAKMLETKTDRTRRWRGKMPWPRVSLPGGSCRWRGRCWLPPFVPGFKA